MSEHWKFYIHAATMTQNLFYLIQSSLNFAFTFFIIPYSLSVFNSSIVLGIFIFILLNITPWSTGLHSPAFSLNSSLKPHHRSSTQPPFGWPLLWLHLLHLSSKFCYLLRHVTVRACFVTFSADSLSLRFRQFRDSFSATFTLPFTSSWK